MSKKTKTDSTTTTNSTTNSTTTPTNPAWVVQGLASLGGRVNNLGNLDPYSLVAGPNPLQDQAAANAANLSGQFWNFDSAADGLRSSMAAGPQSVQAQSLLSGLPNYMSPYTHDVVNAALRDYDFGAGQTRAQNKLALAQDDTFGGSGGALQTALSEDAIDRGRGALSSQLYDQAFQSGANLSNPDAARRQEAATTNANLAEQAWARRQAAANGLVNLASAYDANQRANAATQSTVGDMLRQIQQQQLQAPISLLNSQAGLYNTLPLSLLHGENVSSLSNGLTHATGTTKETGATMGDLLSLAGQLGSAAITHYSDRRWKRDVRRLGELANGLGVYLYRYLWSPQTFIGVMAQEVAKLKPEAVVTLPGGFLAVDYGQL